jgi:hypothetical protein
LTILFNYFSFFILQYYIIHISFFQLLLINSNTHNLNPPFLSKPNKNKNTHKPKIENPHKNSIFKAKEKNAQKEESHSRHKKKKKSILKRTLQKLEEFEDFTLNYVGYGCIDFDKNVARGSLRVVRWLLFLTCVVANLCGSPNDGEINCNFS